MSEIDTDPNNPIHDADASATIVELRKRFRAFYTPITERIQAARRRNPKPCWKGLSRRVVAKGTWSRWTRFKCGSSPTKCVSTLVPGTWR